jgi:hypothetical protein
MTLSSRLAFLLAVVAAAACGRKDDTMPPVATPTVTLARQQAAVGSPLEMKYRFVVAADAPPLAEDYWVFVHFLDGDRELMWTDDHAPPVATRQWNAGQTIEYERTMFVPKFPYTGPTAVEVGLYSRQSGQRLPLEGESQGQRSYVVAGFNLEAAPNDSQFIVFKDGWHATEVADDDIGTEWQWSKKEATLTFRNPKRDVTIYLQVDQPVAAFADAQQVEIRIGQDVVDSFPLRPQQSELRKFALTAAQLGAGETAEMRVSVDRTFVPVNIPALKSRDPRELGIRVFRAYIQPR